MGWDFMEDMKTILRMWYALFEKENNEDIKQSIVFDYIENYPIQMFNAAVWLFSMNASPIELKRWICSPSFVSNIKGANIDIARMDKEKKEEIQREFIISVNEAYLLTYGMLPHEEGTREGLLLF